MVTRQCRKCRRDFRAKVMKNQDRMSKDLEKPSHSVQKEFSRTTARSTLHAIRGSARSRHQGFDRAVQ